MNRESYATLVYLCSGTRPLYHMLRNHFGGTLNTLTRCGRSGTASWSVTPSMNRFHESLHRG